MYIFKQSSKTLLFHNNDNWVKKSGEAKYDVPMGCYDTAVVWEPAACYILNQFSSVIRKEFVGLYRDDDLRIYKNLSGPETKQKRKDNVNVFQKYGLKITIKTKLTSVMFGYN